MPAPFPPSLKSFQANRQGAVAILFGLILFVMMAAIGVTVDIGRGLRAHTRVMAALDSAALATAKALRLKALPEDELQQLAETYFRANTSMLLSDRATYGDISLSVDRVRSSVELRVDVRLPTTITRILNVDSLKIGGRAGAIYEAKDVELAMMLDVSGSMKGSKISALKGAARDLVRIMIEEEEGGERHKIGIVPYSTSVNAGAYARDVTGVTRSHTCVTERTGGDAFNAADPTSAPLGRKTSRCPISEVVPLTNDPSVLARHLDQLTADGSTAGHLGIAWAWYLVSPNWGSIWPADSRPEPYANRDILKAAIIMTDGEFNTDYENRNGSSVDQSRRLCRNMKTAGVMVFTVAFEAPQSAEELLQQCATSPAHHFDAQNEDELKTVFEAIARRLTGLRLTN